MSKQALVVVFSLLLLSDIYTQIHHIYLGVLVIDEDVVAPTALVWRNIARSCMYKFATSLSVPTHNAN